MANNPNFQFTPTDGLLNETSFPVSPGDQTAARTQFMTVFNQLRDFMNGNLVPATTANITLYVNTATGNDSNDGLTSGTAFKTIQKAVDVLPQIINHAVTINVAAGTYAEAVTIYGFSGKGSISLLGDTVVSDSYQVTSISKNQCGVIVTTRGFKGTSTTGTALVATNCPAVTFDYCKVTDAAASPGIGLTRSTGTVSNSTVSNRSNGIRCVNGRIYSSNNTGTGNTIGLSSEMAGTIGKNGTQPAGTTAEVTATGGVIR